MPKCAEPKCGKSFVARVSGGRPQTYCSHRCYFNHYARTHRVKTPRKSWQEQFWDKVLKENCWYWMGYRYKAGYGAFGHRNSWSVSYRECGEYLAHRISWVLTNGPIPDGLWVLHRCDNPPCVNPNHLFLGTTQDNSKDRNEKERENPLKGSRHTQSKVTEEYVKSIRELYLTGKWAQKELADIYGITQSNVGFIVRGITWRHLL